MVTSRVHLPTEVRRYLLNIIKNSLWNSYALNLYSTHILLIVEMLDSSFPGSYFFLSYARFASWSIIRNKENLFACRRNLVIFIQGSNDDLTMSPSFSLSDSFIINGIADIYIGTRNCFRCPSGISSRRSCYLIGLPCNCLLFYIPVTLNLLL